MGSLERQLKRLEDKVDFEVWKLRCPECGWEVTIHGDLWIGLIVLDWRVGDCDEKGNVTYNRDTDLSSYDPNLVALFWHEHGHENFIEKRSGLPLGDPAVSGIGVGLTPPETHEDGS